MYAIDQAEMSMSGKVITGINGRRFSTRNMREQAGVQNTRIVIRTTFKMYMTNTRELGRLLRELPQQFQ